MARGSRAETQHPPLEGSSSFLLRPFPSPPFSPPSFLLIPRTEPRAGAERARGEEKGTALRGSREPGKGRDGEPRARGLSPKATRDPRSLRSPLSVPPHSPPGESTGPWPPLLLRLLFAASFALWPFSPSPAPPGAAPRDPAEGARERAEGWRRAGGPRGGVGKAVPPLRAEPACGERGSVAAPPEPRAC